MVDGELQMSNLSLQDRAKDDEKCEQRANEAILLMRAKQAQLWEEAQQRQQQGGSQQGGSQQGGSQQGGPPEGRPQDAVKKAILYAAEQRVAFEIAMKQARDAERFAQQQRALEAPVIGEGGFNFATLPGYRKATASNCQFTTLSDKLRMQNELQQQYPQFSFEDGSVAEREKQRKDLEERERNVAIKHEKAMRALEKKHEEEQFTMKIERTTLDTVAQADANLLGITRVTHTFLKVLDKEALQREKKQRREAKVHKANAEYEAQLRRQDARRLMEQRTRGQRAQHFQEAREACADPEDY